MEECEQAVLEWFKLAARRVRPLEKVIEPEGARMSKAMKWPIFVTVVTGWVAMTLVWHWINPLGTDVLLSERLLLIWAGAGGWCSYAVTMRQQSDDRTSGSPKSIG